MPGTGSARAVRSPHQATSSGRPVVQALRTNRGGGLSDGGFGCGGCACLLERRHGLLHAFGLAAAAAKAATGLGDTRGGIV